MFLRSVSLRNFRLHINTALNFSNELNYIIGGNGQGKTTILESIYYLCTTKSLNQAQDSEAVNFNKNFFEVIGSFKDLTENKVKVLYDKELNKKSYFVDDKQIYRASSVIGKFPVVTLTQSDHAVTLGSPTERRKFVDSVISQASETYLGILLEYNRTLRQRSSLLSQIKETRKNILIDQLDAWTDTLVKIGTELVKHRMIFLNEFNSYLNESYKKVMEGKEKPFIDYEFLGEKEIDSVEGVFKRKLNEKRNEEILRAQNLIGPHRDDFIFYINNYELRRYGSQGQHKTFQIALKFGKFFYIKDRLGRTPIFLMDDIFGELDTYRANKISKYSREIGQAFITLTDFSNLNSLTKTENDFLIEVVNGEAAHA